MNKIEKLQSLIDNSNNIVFFGGAGVSTDSGIKDFRGKNGLYTSKNENSLPPEYLLSNKCLNTNPELFFDYYRKNMNCLDAEPNITHKYLKKLEDKKKLKAIVTQNIDGLHQKAGASNVIELHGSITNNYCMKCKKKYPDNYIFKSKDIPRCECGGTVRPDIILYGEMLPDCLFTAIDYINEADLLIVAGTSLTVEPASRLVRNYRGKHLVIINNTKTPYDSYAELVINKPLKEVFKNIK